MHTTALVNHCWQTTHEYMALHIIFTLISLLALVHTSHSANCAGMLCLVSAGCWKRNQTLSLSESVRFWSRYFLVFRLHLSCKFCVFQLFLATDMLPSRDAFEQRSFLHAFLAGDVVLLCDYSFLLLHIPSLAFIIRLLFFIFFACPVTCALLNTNRSSRTRTSWARLSQAQTGRLLMSTMLLARPSNTRFRSRETERARDWIL